MICNCSIGAQKSFGLIKIAPKATNKRPQYPLLVRHEQEIPADDVIDFDGKKKTICPIPNLRFL
jgi:hypothetical protein